MQVCEGCGGKLKTDRCPRCDRVEITVPNDRTMVEAAQIEQPETTDSAPLSFAPEAMILGELEDDIEPSVITGAIELDDGSLSMIVYYAGRAPSEMIDFDAVPTPVEQGKRGPKPFEDPVVGWIEGKLNVRELVTNRDRPQEELIAALIGLVERGKITFRASEQQEDVLDQPTMQSTVTESPPRAASPQPAKLSAPLRVEVVPPTGATSAPPILPEHYLIALEPSAEAIEVGDHLAPPEPPPLTKALRESPRESREAREAREVREPPEQRPPRDPRMRPGSLLRAPIAERTKPPPSAPAAETAPAAPPPPAAKPERPASISETRPPRSASMVEPRPVIEAPKVEASDGEVVHQNPKAQGLYEAAIEDQKNGKIASALNNMKLALIFDRDNPAYKALLEKLNQSATVTSKPDSPEAKVAALLEKAEKAESKNEIDKAIALLEEAITLRPEARCYNRLGVILAMRKKDIVRGRELLLKAVEMEPHEPTYRHNLKKIPNPDTQPPPAKATDKLAKPAAGLLRGLLGKRP